MIMNPPRPLIWSGYQNFRLLSLSLLVLAGAPGEVEGSSAEDNPGAAAPRFLDAPGDRNILEVPMTITAFNSLDIEELVLQDRTDLQGLAPGLQFGDELDQEGQGTVVRGIGTRGAYISQMEHAVGTSVDGAYTIGMYGTLPGGGFDLERIEVARGPQSAMNGRSALAGYINYIYKKPSEKQDAVIMTEITNTSQQRVNLAYGGALSDQLFYRLTSGFHVGEGRQDNVGLGGDYDEPDHRFFAPQLRFKTDRLDMNVRYAHVSDRGSPRSLVALSNANTTDEFLSPDTQREERSAASPLGGSPSENPLYLYATPNPAIDPDCPAGVPGFRCGEIRNKVALNASGEEDSSSDFVTFHAQYKLTGELNVRYNYSYGDASIITTRDADYSNRVAIEGDHTVASDGLVSPFNDTRYRHRYDYDESAHEVFISSNYDGPFNFMAGLFTYGNKTRSDYLRIDHATPTRFGTADEQAAAASPVFGLVPVGSCRDLLVNVVEAHGIGSTDCPRHQYYDRLYWDCEYGADHNCTRHWQQSAKPATLTWFCPEGSEHTETLRLVHGGRLRTRSAYFNGAWEVNDRWVVAGGLRYIQDKKEQPPELNSGFALVDLGTVAGVNFPNGGVPEPETWSETIGHISLEYTTRPDNLVYGRVSTGYRAGGFNTPNPGLSSVPHAGEETAINYEAGIKGRYWDSRLQLMIGAWFSDFDGFQVNAHQPPPPGFDLSEFLDVPYSHYTSNIDGTRLWGIDVEFGFQLHEQWEFYGFYAWQDSELGPHSSVIRGNPDAEYGTWEHIDFITGEAVTRPYQLPTDMTGNKLPMQPTHKMALTLAHDRPIGDKGNLHLRATCSFTGSQHSGIGNVPDHEIPSHSRWDASAKWESVDRRWSVLFFVQNIYNEIGLVEFLPEAGIGFSSNTAVGYPTSQREFGMQVRWYPYR